MILIKAYCNSEWDNATHYFFETTNEQVLEWILLQQKLQNEFPEEKYGINSFSYYPHVKGQFVNINEDDYLEDFKDGQIYNIEIEIEEFDLPAQKVQNERIRINKYGVQIIAYGKNSNDEFWTDEIDLNQLLKYVK